MSQFNYRRVDSTKYQQDIFRKNKKTQALEVRPITLEKSKIRMAIGSFIKMARCETLVLEPLQSLDSGQCGPMLHGNVKRSIGI